ncbi:hypothetical protein Ddc_13873 [Ditylenchus destructor]|nr:hypothetical protein Ddc_13873 [Ditylenchus destructor]
MLGANTTCNGTSMALLSQHNLGYVPILRDKSMHQISGSTAVAQIEDLITSPPPSTKSKFGRFIPIPTSKKPKLDRNQKTELAHLLINLESSDIELRKSAYLTLQESPYNVPEYMFHM